MNVNCSTTHTVERIHLHSSNILYDSKNFGRIARVSMKQPQSANVRILPYILLRVVAVSLQSGEKKSPPIRSLMYLRLPHTKRKELKKKFLRSARTVSSCAKINISGERDREMAAKNLDHTRNGLMAMATPEATQYT